MKELSELVFPDDVRYAEDHEWARSEDGIIVVGVSDYAQDQLGDITFVELPEVGGVLDKGREFGTLESTKAVSDVFMPIGGEVTAVNGVLEDEPDRVNRSPYGDGWLIKVKPSDPGDFEALMDREAYRKLLEGAEG